MMGLRYYSIWKNFGTGDFQRFSLVESNFADPTTLTFVRPCKTDQSTDGTLIEEIELKYLFFRLHL